MSDEKDSSIIQISVIYMLNFIRQIMHYLSISEYSKCIDFSVWSKTQALCIFTGNNTCYKGPMPKIVI